MLGTSQILNGVIQPAVRNTDNLSWLFGSSRATVSPANPYSLQSVLGHLAAPPVLAPAPISSMSPGLLNGAAAAAAAELNGSVPLADVRKRPNLSSPAAATAGAAAKRKRISEVQLDEQLHSEQVLAVHLNGDFVYTSSRDGIVKRTPLNDDDGSVVIYKHWSVD